MQILLTYKSKQFFWLLIKLTIVFGCAFFIYQKLFLNTAISFTSLQTQLFKYQFFTFKNMIIVVVFSTLNWFFEIYKWKKLVAITQKISLKESSIQCLASLATSLITPNRIGEYGAKAMFFKKSLRKKIVGFNIIGNFYQLITTLLFGITGFTYFVLTHKVNLNFKSIFTIIILSLIFFGCIYLALYRFKKGKEYVTKITTFINAISFSVNLKTFCFAIFRYLFFSHQFYFLLTLFSVEINYLEAVSAIASVYLIASIVPMLSLLDIVLKSTIAVWVFSFFSVPAIIILTVVSLLWFFNFAIPSLIGSYFVITFKPKLST